MTVAICVYTVYNCIFWLFFTVKHVSQATQQRCNAFNVKTCRNQCNFRLTIHSHAFRMDMCCSVIMCLKLRFNKDHICSFKCHTGATATFIVPRLCESVESILDKVGRHFFFFLSYFFWKSHYRKVLLFISKAPQFRSCKTQSLNKSFNKAVLLTFYCQPKNLNSSWFCDS